MGGAGAIASVIGGFGEGLEKRREQEKKDAYITAQTDLIKQEAKVKEKALLMEQMKSDIFGKMTPEQQMASLFPKADDSLESKLKTIMDFSAKQGGGQAPAPLPDYVPGSGTGPTRPGAMSLPETMASMQGGGSFFGLTKDDLIRGVLKKELGAEAPMYRRTAPVIMPDGNPGTAPMNDMGLIDMSKAVPSPFKLDTQKGVGEGMAPTETPVNPYSRKSTGAPIQTGPPPTMEVETPTGGGGSTRRVLPKFPSLSGSGTRVTGTTSDGVRTQLDLLDTPIPSTDIIKWSDGKGGNPPLGWTPRQAQGRGFKQTQEGMPSETGGKVVMLGQAVDDMEKAIGMILPPGGGFNRKLAIGAATNSPEFAIEGSQIVRSSVLNAMSAKLRMETGAQSNESEIQGIVDRYWPSGVRDNEKSARYKMTRLLQFMRDGKFIMDPKGRIVAIDPPGGKGKPPALGKKNDATGISSEDALAELRRRKVIP
jgi:hypothetical protein